jgi:hypothetical protein
MQRANHTDHAPLRGDSWRKQLFYLELEEARLERRRAQAKRHAIWVGVALGILGSLAFYL